LSNENLFGKVYFPRLIVPVAQLVSNAMSFGIQFVTFFLFWGYFKWSGAVIAMPLAGLWMLPLFGVQLMALSLGLGLCLSSMTTKYRDLSHVLGFFFQLGMYATPIIYSLNQIPAKWRWIIVLNPMSSIVEASRHLLLGTGSLDGSLILLSLAETLFFLVAGLLLFTHASRNFIDTI
jgi:lipopolysaccharide transport system permease protein